MIRICLLFIVSDPLLGSGSGDMSNMAALIESAVSFSNRRASEHKGVTLSQLLEERSGLSFEHF